MGGDEFEGWIRGGILDREGGEGVVGGGGGGGVDSPWRFS